MYVVFKNADRAWLAQVEVVAQVDGWLHCVSDRGAKGLVPASYVRLTPASPQRTSPFAAAAAAAVRPASRCPYA